uniref:Uncharacterized protein LOC100184555 n=1 Tax=Phallusia mammillata TaxID=59560 RepID=A0A6F9DIR4_9ASCI|nr:uncharacterized protein LOC100184555 [Phallusia mammillata]
MKLNVITLALALLIGVCRSSPIERPQESEENSELERRHHHHHHHRHDDGASVENVPSDLDAEIAKLRRLDAIIGKVEEAAMSSVALDVPLSSDDITELTRITAVDEPSLEGFRHVALPYKFRRYDLNNDGFVTPLELADSTGTMLEDSEEPFNRADTNDDGLLTEEELHNAPWVFAMGQNAH